MIAKRTSVPVDGTDGDGTDKLITRKKGRMDHDPIRHPSYCRITIFRGASIQSVFTYRDFGGDAIHLSRVLSLSILFL